MKNRSCFLCAILVVFAIALCAPKAAAQTPDSVKATTSGRVIEKWYMYWGVGYSFASYPNELEKVLNGLDNVPGVSQYGLGLDIFGFYWPISNQAVLGFVMNGSMDVHGDGTNEISITQQMIAISCMHSVKGTIGDGVTVRVDVGMGNLRYAARAVEGRYTMSEDDTSEMGLGLLFGMGYAIPVSSQTSLIVGANFALRFIEDETYGATTIGLGVFF